MANNNDALIPEKWAAEAIGLMYEQFLWGNLVYRDFENEIAQMGETVHVHMPAGFVAERKQNDLDDVVEQDASVVDIPVVLDQRVYVSFIIGDGERSKSFKNLVELHLTEAMSAQVRLIDRCVAARTIDFLANSAGSMGGLTTSNGVESAIDLSNVMNINNVPEVGRNLMLANNSHALMLKNDKVASTDYTGTAGSAVRRAYVGQIAGFETYRSGNAPTATGVATGTPTTVDGAVAAGSTTIVVDATAPIQWQYITVAGDNTPLRVTNVATLTLTVNRATKFAIADAAVVTLYGLAAVDLAGGYATGWAKWIAYDGGTVQVGQMIAFAGNAAEYTVVQVSGSSFMLDRPLESTLIENHVINLGPSGDMNLGFHSKAIALVTRPLALPMEGVGVRSAVINDNGYGIRVTISYDSKKEGHRVTIGSLCGTKTTDVNRGAVLLG